MTKRRKNTNGITQISVRPPALKPSAIESEVAVPVLWSALLALSFGLAVTLAAVALRAAMAAACPWWVALAAGASVAVLVFAWRCSICESDRRALLLYPLEVALGRDLDQDGYVGTPEPETEPAPEQAHRLIYVHNAERTTEQRTAGDFRRFLKGVYNDRGTAWRVWEDTRLPSGRRVTQPLWERWTARLLNAGLAVREHPTATLTLTSSYREALETLREVL